MINVVIKAKSEQSLNQILIFSAGNVNLYRKNFEIIGKIHGTAIILKLEKIKLLVYRTNTGIVYEELNYE